MRTLSHSCPLERGRKIAALGTHAVALSDEDKKNAMGCVSSFRAETVDSFGLVLLALGQAKTQHKPGAWTSASAVTLLLLTGR